MLFSLSLDLRRHDQKFRSWHCNAFRAATHIVIYKINYIRRHYIVTLEGNIDSLTRESSTSNL